jgi:hypothetical protein
MAKGPFANIVSLEDRLAPLLRDCRAEAVETAWLEAASEWSTAVWSAAEALGPPEIPPEQAARALELIERPVFICGTHRSGTTWLHDLLDGHPQLVVLPSEGTYYTALERRLAHLPDEQQATKMGREWLHRLVNRNNQPPFWLLGRSTPQESPYVEFARQLTAWWRVLDQHYDSRPGLWRLAAVALAWATARSDGRLPAGAAMWVEKTPTNERFLGRLWAEFPSARVIHVIREPKAVLASQKAAWPTAWRPTAATAAVFRNLARSYRIAAGQACGPSDRYRLVRYEDVAAQPDCVMFDLAAFLGIEYSASLLEPSVAGLPATRNRFFRNDTGNRERALGWLERECLAIAVGRNPARLGYPNPPGSTLAARCFGLWGRLTASEG